jgi:hypothetical protein
VGVGRERRVADDGETGEEGAEVGMAMAACGLHATSRRRKRRGMFLMGRGQNLRRHPYLQEKGSRNQDDLVRMSCLRVVKLREARKGMRWRWRPGAANRKEDFRSLPDFGSLERRSREDY